jgi:penicillin G amidase
MRQPAILRRVAIIGLVLTGLVMVALLAGYFFLRQSLPRLAGEVRLGGLSAPVEVVRDANAVPHIFAKTWDDAHFALGFVHAQDRLWQMEMNRRIAAGRLAEVLGESALDTDKFFRTLGVRHAAQANLEFLDSETLAALASYAAGVNAYLKSRTGPLPPEFLILGVEPQPWEPADSVAWGKMMAWDLGGNWRTELLRLRLSQKLTPQQISEFLPAYPGDDPLVLPDLRSFYASLAPTAERLSQLFPASSESAVGSNNWVVSGAHSETGKPLLANDPHLALATPAIWYFAHLSVAGFNVIGATLPGTPAVVLGRNDRIAWGFTNTGPDVQDLYVEKLDGAKRYLSPQGYREFTTRKEIIRVKGKDDVTMEVRASRHGPVISDAVAAAAQAVPGGHVLALTWTSLLADDLTTQASYELERASNWSEFLAAVRDFHSPQQNMVYADVDGNIGFIAPGRIPVRSADNPLRGLAPAPGWDARYDWQGFIPFDNLPRSFNPPDGMVVTANQKIVATGYPHFITGEWMPPYRSERIETLLQSTKTHSLDDFNRIQADVTSLAARDILPLLLAVAPDNEDAAAVHRRLAAWNGEMSIERVEPLLFAAWMRELTRLVYSDELGPDIFRDAWDQRTVFMRNVLRDVDGQSRWCDDVTTTVRETCAEMIRRALALALADLRARYGADMSKWRWGDAHPAISDHRPFARQAWLRDWFNISVPVPGDGNTVNVGNFRIYSEATPFAARHAPSLRATYDLADLDRSRFMHSTGQSGNVFSPYYHNFAVAWARTETIPMTTRRREIEAVAIGTLTLVPMRAR